jgi:hypothetical protein
MATGTFMSAILGAENFARLQEGVTAQQNSIGSQLVDSLLAGFSGRSPGTGIGGGANALGVAANALGTSSSRTPSATAGRRSPGQRSSGQRTGGSLLGRPRSNTASVLGQSTFPG